MATDPIPALLAGLPPEVEVQAHERGLWVPVGRGRLTSPAPRTLAFRGQVEALHPGEIALSLALTGEETARIAVGADADPAARWRPYGDGLVAHATLGGRAGEVTFTPGGGGLYVDLGGALRARLWLGPAAD